jgi:DNA-binding NarL/FixJ family response regulator
MQHLNSEMKQQQLDWRRSQVLQYSSEGYSQLEIAHKLQVDLATVNRDIHFLKMQAQ